MKASHKKVFKTIAVVSYPVMVYILINYFNLIEHFAAKLFLIFPVFINGFLLFTFATSLIFPPNIVEKIARSMAKELSPEEIIYCKKVTLVWCTFFILNSSITLFLAFSSNLDAWTIYNGVISYLLMALLFFVEFIYRHWRFRRYVGTPFDALLKKIFPSDVHAS